MIEDYEAINNMTDKQAADIIRNFRINLYGGRCNGKTILQLSYSKALEKAIEKLEGGWIPVTTRDYTKKELEDIKKRLEPYGYDTDVMEGWTYTCALPSEDGQEILVSTKYGVCIDRWSADIDGCWFEDHPERDEVLAWMPLPEGYKKGGDQ